MGICGSGIVDAVSELHRAGIIDNRGIFPQGIDRYVLAPEPARRAMAGVVVVATRKDISEVQLAKAVIRVGIDVLVAEAGVTCEEIDAFIIAGAFGAYLDVVNCARIGMFPTLPPERYRQVGNRPAPARGRCWCRAWRREAVAELAQRVTYVELTVHPNFSKWFMKELRFG